MIKSLTRKVVWLLVLSLIFTAGFRAAGEEITGQEILQQVDEQEEILTGGDLMTVLTFENTHADGTTSTFKFATLAKRKPGEPSHSLMYYLKPEGRRGTIFLSRETEQEEEMWLLLPGLPQPTEIPAADQEGFFAGTTLTYQEIGARNMSERFEAELVEETQVTIGEETVPTYVLDVAAKEGVPARFGSGRVWVGKNNWLILRTRDYNEAGEHVRSMRVEALTSFESHTVVERLVSEYLEEDRSTVVIYEERNRPDEEIADSVFDPDNLADFDPERWGIS